MSLSKRSITTTFYDTECPNCGYHTQFNASNIVQREFLNCCATKKDYYTIDYNIKCQLCLAKFKPMAHRTANFYTNPMKPHFTEVQHTYIARMKSFAAIVPTGVGSLRLSQLTGALKHSPKFDCLSIFLVDDVGTLGSDVAVFITGQNLSVQTIQESLQLNEVAEIPLSVALDYHFNKKPQTLGDVSHVFRR